jgi:hypothetical protein
MPLIDSSTPNIRDLKIEQYKVVVVDAEFGISQDLSQLVSSIQWDYDLDQPAEHYQINFVHTMNISQRVKPGDRIKIYGWAVRPLATGFEIYWELLKRVYISSTSMSSENGGTLRATGYNVMWFLMRNKDTIMLSNETATQFITRTAAYFGIPLWGTDDAHPQGRLQDTGVVLEREAFMNRTLWDMWVSTLSYTRDINPDARFLLQERNGAIDLVARTSPAAVWEFHRGRFIPGPESWTNNPGNIFSSQNNFSMENYANVVRVYKGPSSSNGDSSAFFEGTTAGGTDPTLVFQIPPQLTVEAGTDPEIVRYGMFVESVDLHMPGEQALDLGNDAANAEQQAKKLYDKLVKFENTGTITTFNVNTILPGDPVHIRDDITGMVGVYYVKSGSHVVSDEEASMSLTVNIEDALPEEYAARPQKKDKTDVFFGGLAPAPGTPSGREWTTMSGSVSIPDRYALAVAAGFKPGDEAITMTTISLYECGNCDMSLPNATNDVGLWQINAVHWPVYGGPDILKNPPANARAAFGIFSGAGGNPNGFKQWHVYPNWNGAGAGTPQSAFDAKKAEVAALVASGGNTSQTSWLPTDLRGKLPTNHEAEYAKRSLADITGVTLHYTAMAPTVEVYAVASYQTSEAARGQTGAGVPFPGLAYTLFVELNGKTTLAWDLDVATWHNSAYNRNTTNVGICYAGDVAPSEEQITAMAQSIGWLQKQLGRQLGIDGHKDTYATECPGASWPAWKQKVVDRIPLTL